MHCKLSSKAEGFCSHWKGRSSSSVFAAVPLCLATEGTGLQDRLEGRAAFSVNEMCSFVLWRINQYSWSAAGFSVCPRSSSSSVKKVTKKREEKLFPPPLSPLLDDPVHRRHSSDNSSFSQEPTVTNTSQTSSSSSSASKHRKNENKSSSNPKGICVSNQPPLVAVNKIKWNQFSFILLDFFPHTVCISKCLCSPTQGEWIFAEPGINSSCKLHF